MSNYSESGRKNNTSPTLPNSADLLNRTAPSTQLPKGQKRPRLPKDGASHLPLCPPKDDDGTRHPRGKRARIGGQTKLNACRMRHNTHCATLTPGGVFSEPDAQKHQDQTSEKEAQTKCSRQQETTRVRHHAQSTSNALQQQRTSILQQVSDVSHSVKEAEDFWRQSVLDWYPNLHDEIYFLPPLDFSQIPYKVQHVADIAIPVVTKPSNEPGQRPAQFPPKSSLSPRAGRTLGRELNNPQIPLSIRNPEARVWSQYYPVPPGQLPVVGDSDVRNNRAMQRMLHFIHEVLTKKQEAMVVLSQLQFRRYLDDQHNPISAAAIRLLPRPGTLQFSDTKADQTRGDFDLLIISKHYGLIVGEAKSVGTDPSMPPDIHKAILKAIGTAIKQLNKGHNMLCHLLSDLVPIRVTKTLILPNVTSEQVLGCLSSSPEVLQDLSQCLGVPNADAAGVVCRCLCADDVASPESSKWWERTVTDRGSDGNMTPELYETLVARFCGPATTIDVPTITTPRRTVPIRNMTDAVALTGRTMSMLTLYPEQVDLLNRPEIPRMFLWGPPGTGKTVVLFLKGLQWVRQGKDVHLLSTHKYSRSVILLIEHQLLHTPQIGLLSSTPSRAASATETVGASGTLTTMPPSTSTGHTEMPTSSPRVHVHFFDFERKEGDVDAAVHILASAACHEELYVIADEAFKAKGRFPRFCNKLNARVPGLHIWAAAVKRHEAPACMKEEKLTVPVRCPPAVIREVEQSWYIKERHVPSYTGSPAPAPTDGPKVEILAHWQRGGTRELMPEHSWQWPWDCVKCGDAIADQLDKYRVGRSDGRLEYRDTIILCEYASEDLPAVTRLRERGVPLQVVTVHDDLEKIRDVASAKHDLVTVTDWGVITGLERKVVIVMGWWNDLDDRLFALSRCTALLVCVGLFSNTPLRYHI